MSLLLPISTRVDGGYGIRICYRDVIWLNSDQGLILIVDLSDSQVAPPSSGLQQKPKFGEASKDASNQRSRDITKASKA